MLVVACPLALQRLVLLLLRRHLLVATSSRVGQCLAVGDGDVSAVLLLARRPLLEGFVAWSRHRHARDRGSQKPTSQARLAGSASLHFRDLGPSTGREERPWNGVMAQHRRSAGVPGVTCDAPLDARPSAPGPLGPGAGGEPDDAAAWGGERDERAVHEEQRAPRGGARPGDDVCRTREEADSDRPDASPVVSNRHCSPVLLGSCPPACLRRMGSARANRSGWSPGSEWKEFE